MNSVIAKEGLHAVKSFNWTLRVRVVMQTIEMRYDACSKIFLLFDKEILMSEI